MWSEQGEVTTFKPSQLLMFWTMVTPKLLCLEESSAQRPQEQRADMEGEQGGDAAVAFVCWELTAAAAARLLLHSLIDTGTTKHFPWLNLSLLPLGLLLYLH